MVSCKEFKRSKRLLSRKIRFYLSKRTKICLRYFLKENNLPIDYVNIDLDDSHDLGYGLKKEYWHQGIVSEAVEAVIQQAKKDNLCYLTATHDIKNIHSGNVMKKVGMHYCYSYKEQWMPKNRPVIFRMYQINLDGKNGFIKNIGINMNILLKKTYKGQVI